MQWGKETYKMAISKATMKIANRRGHADVGPIRSGANVPYVDSNRSTQPVAKRERDQQQKGGKEPNIK